MSGIPVSELVSQCRARDTRLPFEIGAFVALETTEALMKRPVAVTPDDVLVQPDGHLRIASSQPASDPEAAQGAVGVLSRLLVAAGAGVPPVLLELVEKGPHSGRWSLTELRDELEASLIPLNRGAARRVLSRLLRDAERRPRSAPPRSAAPPLGDVDADLDALLEGRDPEPDELATTQMPAVDARGNPVVSFDEVAAKPGQRALPRKPRSEPASEFDPVDPLDRATPLMALEVPPEARPSDERLDAGDTLNDDEPAGAALDDPGFEAEATPMPAAPPPSTPPPPRPESSRPPPSPEGHAVVAAALDRAAGERPSTRPIPGGDPALDLDQFDLPEPRKGKGGLVLVIALGLLLVGGAVAVFVFRPDVVARLTGDAPEEEPPPEPETIVNRPEGGDLIVHGPEGSQILLFVGRGPTTVEYLPQGVAHELVATTDEGTTRSIVPADATWDEGAERPRYELAMQVSPSEGELGASTLDPGAMGTPTGGLGDVRVITNPPGAKVFLLVGFGEAHVEDVPVAEAHEVVVYTPGEPLERLVVGPSDWEEGPDGKRAELGVEGSSAD